MTNNKEKYAFWLTPEAKKMIETPVCGDTNVFSLPTVTLAIMSVDFP